MTAAERLRAERKIDELLAAAYCLRVQLRIDEFRQMGVEVPPVWQTAERVVEERRELARAMANACGSWGE